MDGMKLGKRQLGAASCHLAPSDALPAKMREVIEVSSVHVDEWHRRKGIANRLMDQICEEADKEKTVLILMPDGEPWLQQWYRTHGFVTLQPEPLIMARPPYQLPN